MKHPKTENRGRPSEQIIESPRKFIRTFYEVPSKPELGEKSVWHYDLDKSTNGPYLVEHFDPTYDKLESLHNKLERLQKPKYHENGRKKRTTKADKEKINSTEAAYWEENYRLFPDDKPKKRGRKRKNRTNS